MKHDKKEDLLSIFSVSLALIACAVLVYMLRTPVISGNVALDAFGQSTIIILISLLILIVIAVIIGAIVHVHNMHKEKESHKKAIAEGKELTVKHLNHELVDYIKRAKKNGFKKAQIIAKLKQNNWKDKEIKNYFSSN